METREEKIARAESRLRKMERDSVHPTVTCGGMVLSPSVALDLLNTYWLNDETKGKAMSIVDAVLNG